MLLIAVDVLEIFWQYELISDGKVIFKKMDEIVCDEDPIYCSLPAGGKLSPNKRATKKKKKKENEKKRNEDKKERKKKMKEKNGRKEGRKNKKKRGLRED